jgi:hypothetical protein
MFKTWLISNLGIVYVVCALIIIGLSAVFLPTESVSENETSTWFIALYGIVAISCVLLFAAEPSIGPIVSVFLLVGLYIFFIYTLKHPEDGSEVPEKAIRTMNTIVISLSVLCSIPAFFIARYANVNFYDVVSRRWMYRNSAKSVFESTWKYTFNRFCMAFLVVFCLLLDLALVIILAAGKHSSVLDPWLNLK